MGPWYNDAARTTAFVNMPANQKALYRFPRTPSVPTSKTTTGGEVGYMEYSQSLARVITVKTNYIEALAQYNQAVLTLEFLAGNDVVPTK